MKLALLAFSTILACGSGTSLERWHPSSYVEGVPVIGDICVDEIQSITRVEQAILQLSKTPEWTGIKTKETLGLIIVRQPGQEVPEICKGRGCSRACADTWAEYPDVLGTEERVKGEGYSGLQKQHLFVSVIGDRAGKFEVLYAHERAHEALDVGDGPQVKALTRAILESL